MQNLQFILTLSLAFMVNFNLAQAQSMTKSYKTIKVEREINAPADKVWQAMVLDYGEISNFAPSIYASNYEKGSLKGEVGAQRKCSFNEKGSRWTQEQIKELDAENKRMKNIILDAAKFPLDKDNSYAIYQVKDQGDGTSTASYEFNYRTKPAFMGGMVKGKFRKLLTETLMGLDHYVTTGEIVNANTGNWKTIKKKYQY